MARKMIVAVTLVVLACIAWVREDNLLKENTDLANQLVKMKLTRNMAWMITYKRTKDNMILSQTDILNVQNGCVQMIFDPDECELLRFDLLPVDYDQYLNASRIVSHNTPWEDLDIRVKMTVCLFGCPSTKLSHADLQDVWDEFGDKNER